jgi:hypothetical protein
VTATPPPTVWVRQEGETPGAPIYANAHIARQRTKADCAAALDISQEALIWIPGRNGGFELYEGGEATDWSIWPTTVITEES